MKLETDVKRLDQLIATIGGDGTGMRSAGSCELLLEHLQAARRDLFGSMSDEYRANLQLARDSVSCISDKSRRTEVKESLKNLIDSGTRGGIRDHDERTKSGRK
jgi:hypothetical protein